MVPPHTSSTCSRSCPIGRRKPFQAQAPSRSWSRRWLSILTRRPDLAEIEFTCQNVNTLVPMVDLTLEVLEGEVARLSVPGGLAGGLDTFAISSVLRTALARQGVEISPDATVEVVEAGHRWAIRQPGLRVVLGRLRLRTRGRRTGGTAHGASHPQSVGDANELAAYPRFINGAAYVKLANASRPGPFRSISPSRRYVLPRSARGAPTAAHGRSRANHGPRPHLAGPARRASSSWG